MCELDFTFARSFQSVMIAINRGLGSLVTSSFYVVANFEKRLI